jgi:23S rRNA (pseudouridine1915-N3)-methyltransferase
LIFGRLVRLFLVCVGRLKAGPERELVARYVERATGSARTNGFAGFQLREIEEGRARRPDDRKAEEAKAIVALLPAGTRLLAFDERGAPLSSEAFAADLGRARDEGLAATALVIGGPDGLDPALRDSASRIIAFGTMTWPHQLVRAMAAEQVYRAMTILSGHPYHRA